MIVLLDPALRNNNNVHSTNLGDLIISEAVTSNIKAIFPKEEIVRISTHTHLEKQHYNFIKDSKYTFIGGSNLLSSHLLKYHQWKFAPKYSFDLLNPKMQNIVLLGVGWWQYQGNPDIITRRFYSKVLSKNIKHSVRDGYTKEKLETIGINNVINTSCPTLWKLDGISNDRKSKSAEHVVFTLTDYNPDREKDEAMIGILLEYFKNLTFFSQGSLDQEYILSLETYRKNKQRIQIISSIEEYKETVLKENIVYIGTRLHGGVYALQHQVDSLIISIDNRAEEIKKDINLCVVKRGDVSSIRKWIEQKTNWGHIELDTDSIKTWINQFQ